VTRRLKDRTCWTELRFFLQVAHTGSYGKAAQQLGISHPTTCRNAARGCTSKAACRRRVSSRRDQVRALVRPLLQAILGNCVDRAPL